MLMRAGHRLLSAPRRAQPSTKTGTEGLAALIILSSSIPTKWMISSTRLPTVSPSRPRNGMLTQCATSPTPRPRPTMACASRVTSLRSPQWSEPLQSLVCVAAGLAGVSQYWSVRRYGKYATEPVRIRHVLSSARSSTHLRSHSIARISLHAGGAGSGRAATSGARSSVSSASSRSGMLAAREIYSEKLGPKMAPEFPPGGKPAHPMQSRVGRTRKK